MRATVDRNMTKSTIREIKGGKENKGMRKNWSGGGKQSSLR